MRPRHIKRHASKPMTVHTSREKEKYREIERGEKKEMPMQRMGDDIAYVNDIHLARIELVTFSV